MDSFLVIVRARSLADFTLPTATAAIAVFAGVGGVLGLRDPNLARAYY
jgi:hypothetical protein